MSENLLGTDFRLDADNNLLVADGDLVLLDGLDTLHANLLDRLRSAPGALLHHPDFGAGLQDALGETLSRESLDQLAAEAGHQLEQDPRVRRVTRCRATPDQDQLLLEADIELITGQTLDNLVFPLAWSDRP